MIKANSKLGKSLKTKTEIKVQKMEEKSETDRRDIDDEADEEDRTVTLPDNFNKSMDRSS